MENKVWREWEETEADRAINMKRRTIILNELETAGIENDELTEKRNGQRRKEWRRRGCNLMAINRRQAAVSANGKKTKETLVKRK